MFQAYKATEGDQEDNMNTAFNVLIVHCERNHFETNQDVLDLLQNFVIK